MPVVTAIQPQLRAHTVLTADAGYHTNLRQLAQQHIPALIADHQMRRRDARFATQARHQVASHPLHNKTRDSRAGRGFTPDQFVYGPVARTGTCPAGKSLYPKGQTRVVHGYITEQFRGTKRDCAPCTLRARCLRTPDTTLVRNVAFGRGRIDVTVSHTEQMRQRIDSVAGRAQYAQRFATVEPVFGNLRYNKRLDNGSSFVWCATLKNSPN
ncbi:MAG: transposase [Gemmatimonadaceae bacterium]